MTGVIILGIFLVILTWVLLAPLYLYIHTGESRYEAGMRSLFKGKFVAETAVSTQAVNAAEAATVAVGGK